MKCYRVFLFQVFLSVNLFVSTNGFCEQTFKSPYSSIEARKFVEEVWFPSWLGGKGNAKNLTQLFAKDGKYIDPNVPQGIVGHEALNNFFEKLLDLNPHWKFDLVKVFPVSSGLIVQWLGKIPYEGREIELSGIDVIEFNSLGEIKYVEEFFDRSVFFKDVVPSR